MIQRHERELRIGLVIDDRQIDSVSLSDGNPILYGGSAERIDGDT